MAEMQKMTKDEALAKVAQGVGSIYSKEDVVNLINSIECGSASITEELKDQIANAAAYEIHVNSAELVDDCDVDVCKNYGNSFEIEVLDVDLNETRLEATIREVLDAHLEDKDEGPTHFEVEVEEDMETE